MGEPFRIPGYDPLESHEQLDSSAEYWNLSAPALVEDLVFRLQAPLHRPDVPYEVLDPRGACHDPPAYERKAAELAQNFADNFAQYKGLVSRDVFNADPRTGEP